MNKDKVYLIVAFVLLVLIVTGSIVYMVVFTQNCDGQVTRGLWGLVCIEEDGD